MSKFCDSIALDHAGLMLVFVFARFNWSHVISAGLFLGFFRFRLFFIPKFGNMSAL